MSGLAAVAVDYLAVRRAVGYHLAGADRLLFGFVADLEAHGGERITVAHAVAWAAATARGGSGAERLTVVRGFARYAQAVDAANEVPPAGMIPNRTARRVPHLYSDADVNNLMAAARGLDPPLRAATTETVIGLLWVSGMRISEVLKLNVADVDMATGVATVWLSKFNKSRHVPLAASTSDALTGYLDIRRRHAPDTNALFVTAAGNRLGYPAFNTTFHQLIDTVGVSPVSARPTIHDFRHSFAVRTVLGWYRDDVDVQALLPRLSTYLGHVAPSSTYWYLSASPQLMAIVADRLDRHREAMR